MKVQKGDIVSIRVLNGFEKVHDTVYADVTFVSDTGRVYFKPRANMAFMISHSVQIENKIYTGQVYSTDEFDKGVFTGAWRNILSLSLCTSSVEQKTNELPKHDYGTARFTTKADVNGEASVVVDKANDFFKAFSSGSKHHHYLTPQTKLDSTLTSKCEEAVKSAEELREAAFVTERVVKHGDIEYTVRMMLKAGLTPYQIAEEIQRQLYNAMVNE